LKSEEGTGIEETEAEKEQDAFGPSFKTENYSLKQHKAGEIVRFQRNEFGTDWVIISYPTRAFLRKFAP
jgi:hypothetical protein